MSNIVGAGFNAGSDNGEFDTLESDLRALARLQSVASRGTVEIVHTSNA